MTVQTTLMSVGVAAILSFAPVTAPAQSPDSSADFGRYLYPPELIMKYQQRIGLRPEQRATITQAIQQLQGKVIEIQWRMQEETQKLSALIQQPLVSETDALAQVDHVLSLEREIKRAHLTTLIHIKNTLSREQQKALDSLR